MVAVSNYKLVITNKTAINIAGRPTYETFFGPKYITGTG